MSKRLREVVVKDKTALSPNMNRIVLAGDDLADFPAGMEGGYIKLVFPQEDAAKPTVRSYSIRSFEQESREVTIDMVAHGDTGPAASWANHVEVGQGISINGPGACQPINPAADWFLLAGDMSALPAISVNLEALPADAKGYLVLEVISEQDKIELSVPEGMEVHWIINPEPESDNSLLEDKVMNLPWLEGTPATWVAGEFSASRALRQYFRKEKAIPKEFMYVSCYWKIGETDEGMKAAKRADSEAW